jgi:hypothetical protein
MEDIANQAATQVPAQPPAPPAFKLPDLDSSLNPTGQAAKAKFEKANPGKTYTPVEDDYTDSGPYGYLHKKDIHDKLQQYEAEMEANMPNVDYKGIMKQKLADLATMPREHRNNPLLMFAMGMGNPEHAAALVQKYSEDNKAANADELDKWKNLLQIKQDAIKGAMQQAMQTGDMRRVVTGKYADQLMEIEHAKSALQGQLDLAKTKGDETARVTALKMQASKDMLKSRMDAMLSAVGIKMDSAEYRGMHNDAQREIDTRISKGEDPLTVTSDVMDRMHDQLDQRVLQRHGGTAAEPAPAETGAPVTTDPTAGMSPLKRQQYLRLHPPGK